jgi:hypothetical protein
MIAARALLVLFGFVAALATAIVLVMATISQMQWQYPPENVEYAPVRPAPLPPANRAPTPADVGEIDQTELQGAPQQQYRPTLAPTYQAPQTTYTPSVPVGPPADVRPRPAPKVDPPAPVAAEPRPARPPRAAPEPPPPSKNAGGFRRVGAKTFKQQEDGFFVDTTYHPDAGMKVVELVAGSPEYARLLQEHADFAPYFRLSDRLVVVLDGAVYRIVP